MNIVLKKRIVLLFVVSLLILSACKPAYVEPTSVPTLAIPTETPSTSKVSFNRVYLEDELEYIYIDISSVSSFAEELGKYPNITAISLRNTTSIPEEVWQLEELEGLKVSGLSELPSEIGRLTKLRELDLGGNTLRELPPEIGNLTNLEILRLWGNELTTLPPEIGNLSNLRELDLVSNDLIGIPPEIGELSNLWVLIISGNRLKSLPPEIGDLSQLVYLSIGSNHLSTLPASIGKLTSLNTLSVAGNENFSEFPHEMGMLTNLAWLYVRDTPFDTPIANFPVEMESLDKLSIEYSFFTSIAVSEVESLSDEEIIELLMSQWLSQYLSEKKESSRQITDFEITEISIKIKKENYTEVRIAYRVKPFNKSTGWYWYGSDGFWEGEWIRRRSSYVLYIVDDYYALRGPYSG